MATPNMPSSAQDIINKFLTGGFQTTDSTNPYIVPVDPYVPPAPDPEDTIPDCSALFPNENRVYDPIQKACVLVEEEQTGDDGDDKSPEEDPTEALLKKMRNDPTTGYGASNILDDYITEGLGQGTFLKFDPNVGKPNIPLFPLASAGLGFLDTIFGGDKRRLDKYNEALKFMEDMSYGQSVGNDLFQVFTPTEYYRRTSGNLLNPQVPRTPEGQNVTVGEAVEAVINQQKDGSYPTAEGTGSGRIAEDLSGGLLYTSPLTSVDSSGNRTRNNDAYRAAIARNIERNKKNFGSSGFSMNVGGTGMAGFTRGR
jgi:hypothetical protein